MPSFSTTVYSDDAGNFFDANGNPIDVSVGILKEGPCPPELAPDGPEDTEPWCFMKGDIRDTVYRRTDGVYVNLAGEPVSVTGGSLVRGACETDTPYEAIRYCYNPCQGEASYGVWRHEDGTYVDDSGNIVDVSTGTVSEGECPITDIKQAFCYTDQYGQTTQLFKYDDGLYYLPDGSPYNVFDVEGVLRPGSCTSSQDMEMWCARYVDGGQIFVWRLPNGDFVNQDGSPAFTTGAVLTKGLCTFGPDLEWCFAPHDGSQPYSVTQEADGTFYDDAGNVVTTLLGVLTNGRCPVENIYNPDGYFCFIPSSGADPIPVTEDPDNPGTYIHPYTGGLIDPAEGNVEPHDCALPGGGWCFMPTEGDPIEVYNTDSGFWIDGDGNYIDTSAGELIAGNCVVQPPDGAMPYCYVPNNGDPARNIYLLNNQWIYNDGTPVVGTDGPITAGPCSDDLGPTVQYCYDGLNIWQMPDGSYNTFEDGSGDPFFPADSSLLTEGECVVEPVYYCCGLFLDPLGNPSESITVEYVDGVGYVDSSGNVRSCESVTEGVCQGDPA